MLYYFFDDIEALKQFAGGAANLSVSLASLEPGLNAAYENHVRPFISPELWQQLQTAAGHEEIPGDWMSAATPTTGVWATDPDNYTAAQLALLPYLQRPLAMLALYEYTATSSLQLSEAGLMRVESENTKTAYKYQERQYRQWLLHNGYEGLERLVAFLHTHVDDYSAWEDSDAQQRHTAVLLNTAALMRTHYSSYISRYTYEAVRPLIEDIELFGVVSTIGQEQYDALLAVANTATGAVAKAIKALRKAIANYTVVEALRRQWVYLEGHQILQRETMEPQGYQTDMTPAASTMSLPDTFHREWADRYMSRTLAIMTDNIDDFPEYATLLEERTAAEAAAAATTDYTERGTTAALYDTIQVRNDTAYKGLVGL